MTRRHQAEVVVTWVALAIWTWTIWGFGGDSFTPDATSRFIRPLLQSLFPGLSPDTLDTVHVAIRKGAHAFEYGVLALLAFRSLLVTGAMTTGRAAAVTLVFAAMLAASDEVRQALSETRQGALTDVVLDIAAAGATIAALRLLPSRTTRLLVGSTLDARCDRGERATRQGR